jgi:hypothetical protein
MQGVDMHVASLNIKSEKHLYRRAMQSSKRADRHLAGIESARNANSEWCIHRYGLIEREMPIDEFGKAFRRTRFQHTTRNVQSAHFVTYWANVLIS